LHPGIPLEGQKLPWDPETMAARRGHFAEAAAAEGLEVGERTHWYNSTRAHEAAMWADEQGKGEAFRKGVFRAYFVKNDNIASDEVLGELATAVGLDADGLKQALAAGTYRERVEREYEESRQAGVTAVPTFVAGRYAIVGAHPYSSFQKLMEALEQPPR
jgi:predicted DsbA family dithiol-disulfide isomerase